MNEYIQGWRPTSRDEMPAKPDPTDSLKLKRGAGGPYTRLLEGIEEKGSNCVDRIEEFSDYEEPPSDYRAKVLCHGCPVFDLCQRYAETAHPAWGIHAGRVYGRELYRREKEE